MRVVDTDFFVYLLEKFPPISCRVKHRRNMIQMNPREYPLIMRFTEYNHHECQLCNPYYWADMRCLNNCTKALPPPTDLEINFGRDCINAVLCGKFVRQQCLVTHAEFIFSSYLVEDEFLQFSLPRFARKIYHYHSLLC